VISAIRWLSEWLVVIELGNVVKGRSGDREIGDRA
jgi:hypothetical protein